MSTKGPTALRPARAAPSSPCAAACWKSPNKGPSPSCGRASRSGDRRRHTRLQRHRPHFQVIAPSPGTATGTRPGRRRFLATRSAADFFQHHFLTPSSTISAGKSYQGDFVSAEPGVSFPASSRPAGPAPTLQPSSTPHRCSHPVPATSSASPRRSAHPATTAEHRRTGSPGWR